MIYKSNFQRFLFAFTATLSLVSAVYGQSNLKYERKTDKGAEIENILRYSNRLEVYLSYTLLDPELVDEFFCINQAISLQEVSTGETIRLIYKDVDGLCPYAIKLDSLNQKIKLKLVFNPVPSQTKFVNLLENSGSSGINFYKIQLPSVIKQESQPKTKPEPRQSSKLDCENIEYRPATIFTTFENMLSKVNDAVILIPEVLLSSDQNVINALEKYILAMGFENVRLSSDDYKTPEFLSSEISIIPNFTFDRNNLMYYGFELYFVHANGANWSFKSEKTVYWSANRDIKDQIYSVFTDMYGFKKPSFNPQNRPTLAKYLTCYDLESLKKSFLTEGADQYEGIFQSFPRGNSLTKTLIGIKRIKEAYHLIYLDGALNSGDWMEGELVGILTPTATPGVFSTRYFFEDKSETNDPITIFSNTGFQIIFNEKEKVDFLKTFPSFETVPTVGGRQIRGSGTGWAISSDGFIVTNFHVVNGAKKILIRGVNGDFERTFEAKVLINDPNNDLAILKITDSHFSSLGTIPYTIGTKNLDVGNDVFVFGYPLLSTMGEEIKLTNGIISSNSGFKGDITTYQISAPAQSGNSGGPVFNKHGEVIGILSAKHAGAENASYAIKITYLHSLISASTTKVVLPTMNTLRNLSLPEQVKRIKTFVYIIEVE